MQKGHQSVTISQQTKNEAIRAYENLVDDNFSDDTDSDVLIAKLQVTGNELIEALYKLNSSPEFSIGLQIDHEGVVLFIANAGDEFEKLSALFTSEESTDIAIKLSLIADEIQIDQSEHLLRFIFESNSLYRELANSRIKTLKKYFEPEHTSKLKTHDSF